MVTCLSDKSSANCVRPGNAFLLHVNNANREMEAAWSFPWGYPGKRIYFHTVRNMLRFTTAILIRRQYCYELGMFAIFRILCASVF